MKDNRLLIYGLTAMLCCAILAFTWPVTTDGCGGSNDPFNTCSVKSNTLGSEK